MIGVVGQGAVAEAVAASIDGVHRWSATEAVQADAEVIVAAGEAAVIDLVAAGVDRPILPVDVEGIPSATTESAPEAIEHHRKGRADTTSHPLLAVATEAGPVDTAGFDVMLVRSEPGRISEFGLTAGSARARFRADGVVVATPAGSGGYASAAGGPRLDRSSDSVAVVPVAAFGLGAPTWVVDPAAGLELRVERDEGEVSLLVDGREVHRLSGASTVGLTLGGSLTTIAPTG